MVVPAVGTHDPRAGPGHPEVGHHPDARTPAGRPGRCTPWPGTGWASKSASSKSRHPPGRRASRSPGTTSSVGRPSPSNTAKLFRKSEAVDAPVGEVGDHVGDPRPARGVVLGRRFGPRVSPGGPASGTARVAASTLAA